MTERDRTYSCWARTSPAPIWLPSSRVAVNPAISRSLKPIVAVSPMPYPRLPIITADPFDWKVSCQSGTAWASESGTSSPKWQPML